jgi:histone deacetylase complex regulatory component SIN3
MESNPAYEGVYDQGLILFKKIEKSLSSDLVYARFLNHLCRYHDEEIEWSQFKLDLANLFGVSDDLVNEFDDYGRCCEKLSDKDGIESDQEEIKAENPSYRVLNENQKKRKASQREELEHQVLNETLTFGKYELEGYARDTKRKRRIKTPEEKLWDKFEDDKYGVDLTVEILRSLTKRAKKLEKMMIQGGDSGKQPIRIEDHLEDVDLRCIEKIYKQHGIEFVQVLCDNPRDALPIVVPRLQKKLKQFKKVARFFTFKNYSEGKIKISPKL